MMRAQTFPSMAGTYALCLRLTEQRSITVGSLGPVAFASGVYVYVGSAFGPGGLRARLRRHLRGSDTRHWHIDYLRAVARPCGVWYTTGERRLECVWSQALAEVPGMHVPVAGFGASDCEAGCEAHLVAVPAVVPLAEISKVLSGAEARYLCNSSSSDNLA